MRPRRSRMTATTAMEGTRLMPQPRTAATADARVERRALAGLAGGFGGTRASAVAVGSGAPVVGRGRGALLAGLLGVAVLAFALALVPTASAEKFYSGDTIGATGATGGLFGSGNDGVGDVAVNSSAHADSHDGWIYVVDRGNRRIQAFDADLEFQWAIGRNVITDTPTGGSTDLGDVFEKCEIAEDCRAGVAGNLGGELDVPTGIDIDQQTGSLFVRERDGNRRVQEFSADGDFVRAFGFDVVQPGGADEVIENHDERQTVAVESAFGSPPSGGTFTLSFDGGGPTAAIDRDASAGAVEAEFEALSTVGAGNVEVSGPGGGPWTVVFVGALGGQDVPALTGDGSGLTGGFIPSVAVTTDIDGGPGPGFETCTVASECKASPAGALAGQFGSSTDDSNGLAVAPPGAPNARMVYAADAANHRIVSFDVPADPGEPVVAGEPLGSAAEFDREDWPRDVAADANGVVYGSLTGSGGATNTNGIVLRFDTQAGIFMSPISPDSDDEFFDRGTITNFEIDHATGHFVTARAPGSGGDGPAFEPGVLELDLTDKPAVVDVGHLVEVGTQGLGVYGTSSPHAIGIGDGRYFLPVPASTSVAGTGSGHRVLVLDDQGVQPPPAVTIDPVGGIGATTATFSGHVDPVLAADFATFYRWQVSKDGIEWVDVTDDAPVGGDGFTAADVEHAATGLEPNTTYRLRIRTQRNPAAGTAFSAQLLFQTTPAEPTVETRPAQQVADTSALLLGGLNPGGLDAEWWFEWGDTDLANRVPVPAAAASGGSDRIVAATLGGLEPERVYLYRLCARNSIVGEGKVCGDSRSLQTRSPATSGAPDRALEMTTSPDKPLRRGGERGTVEGFSDPDIGRFQSAWPAASGGRIMWTLFGGATDEDAGTGFTYDRNRDVYTRQPGGAWRAEAVLNAPATVRGAGDNPANSAVDTVSSDIDMVALASLWHGPFAEGSFESRMLAIRAMSDDGGPLGLGWYRVLHPDWHALAGQNESFFGSVFDDSAQHLLVQGNSSTAQGSVQFRDVTPADGGPAPQTAVDPSHPVLDPPQTSGRAVFATGRGWDWRPADLVNECTGDAGGGPALADVPTALPARLGTGAATDAIGVRDCEAGAPTDVRGATYGARDGGRLGRGTLRAISDGGRRVFFASPDPAAAASTCATATDAGTSCPPQLFVRQYDANGENPVVRWISRAGQSLFDAPQQIGLLGNGVAFEGASRDGSVVYFRTNAPLTEDDPNGAALGDRPVTDGVASPLSWDLYRYELPAGAGADPADGTLTRVSGGPDGDADPNTNCASSAPDCGGASNGAGGALRYMSEAGDRAYFVTAARIGDSGDGMNAPPAGSSAANVPTGGADQANDSTRNLYSYDADGDDYRFVARLPFATGGLDACASSGSGVAGPPLAARAFGGKQVAHRLGIGDPNCVFGSRAGDAVVFTTDAQLTADDVDDIYDVYIYDAAAHELVRLSAPGPGASAYRCLQDNTGVTLATCNGDLGYQTGGSMPIEVPSSRHWGIGHDADGRLESVFFQSRLPLTPDAADNGALKVYEWRRDGGRLALVSPAETPESAILTGNSLDGRDVFFWTEQRISAWEVEDGDGDVYNATTRTDLRPDPPAPPPVCGVLAGACQGAGAAPVAAAPASVAPRTGENAEPGVRKRLAVGGVGRRARRLAARRGLLRVRVRANRAGRVAVAVRGRVGRRVRRVGRAVVRLSEPGVAAARVRLRRPVRKRLRRGRRVVLVIRARSAGARPAAARVTLRRGRR